MKLYSCKKEFFKENGVSDFDVVIVGAGLSGCIFAEQFALHSDKSILILDKRDHIGGNCYDFTDSNGILMCKYGAHIFRTNSEMVWNYVNKFEEWVRWEHKVIAYVNDRLVPVPVNITTVNVLCKQNLQNTSEMEEWLVNNQMKYEHIANSEQMACSRVGITLYEKIFKTYTTKLWNRDPAELSPEVLARIPIHKTFDDRYFSERYQALPKSSYTTFFHKLLHSDKITVALGLDYFEVKDDTTCDQLIYTGPIDHYYTDLGYEPLQYRSLRFEVERYRHCHYYQPNSVVNYPGLEFKFNRIVEFKHFLNQQSDHTTIVREYGQDEGEPYYPLLDHQNKELYQMYKKKAQEETDVLFVGRLANFKYFSMDEAIENALGMFREKILPHLEENYM